MSNCNTDIPELICGILMGLIPLVVLWFTVHRDSRLQVIDKYNSIYKKTFSLRNQIQHICYYNYGIRDFYFEIELILDHSAVKDCVMDYLNEMEDFFCYILKHNRLNNVFKRLISYALYSRLVFFYGLILKLRIQNNDPTLFSNYIKVLKQIERIKKIKKRIDPHKKIYYIGIRESDIDYSVDYFDGRFAMFAKNSAKFDKRPNQNKPCDKFFPYLNNIENGQKKRTTANYMSYNATIAYGLNQKMTEKFICLNDIALINALGDKAACKTWLCNNNIPIIDFETKFGRDIISYSDSLFERSNNIVLQSNFGGGGIGTFLINKENFGFIKSLLNPIKKYMISSYIDCSISVNTHVFLSEKQTVLSPASIQIVELHDDQLCYRGADYKAFQSVSKEIKEKVKSLSLQIANLLRGRGYMGVAGIDFIIDKNGGVYCTEINPRFQASSILLDKYISSTEKNNPLSAHSIYELNEQAFNNNMKTTLSFDDEISYSCYYYYNDGLPLSYFKKKISRLKESKVHIDMDGLDFNENFDKDSYMFRAVFNHSICQISPDNELWINDNVKIVSPPPDALSLKISLLNQGVVVDAATNIKQGVYESVDITLTCKEYGISNLDINCAVGINLSQFSPFTLNCHDNKLYYYDDILGSFDIEHDILQDFTEDERKILYIATDRLRIKCISGCEYKNRGLGCDFCNVPPSQKRFSTTEIINALNKLKQKNAPIRHILIGGGTCLNNNIWDDIIAVASYLRNDNYYKNMPISLMSIFPPEDKLTLLQSSGITEVAFNLEIADEILASKYMRGKYQGKEQFYINMEKAVNVFGVGNVRSALLVGIDRKDTLLNMVKSLSESNIVPCLSAVRALPQAKIKMELHPSNDYLYEIHNECNKILVALNNSINSLGPPCKRCGNNMLVI